MQNPLFSEKEKKERNEGKRPRSSKERVKIIPSVRFDLEKKKLILSSALSPPPIAMLSLGTQPLCFRRREIARNIAFPGARGRRCTGAARRPRRSRALADDDDEEIVASTTTSLSSSSSLSSRRAALVRAAGLSIAAAAAAVSFPPAFPSSVAAAEATTAAAKAEQQAPDFVTARAFLDVALCPSGYRPDRTLGDATALCSDPEPLGRLVLGLYGNAAPGTVEQFLALVRAGELDGTLFHKVIRGSYLMGGKQGSRRMGELSPAWSELLPSSPSSSSPSSSSSNNPSSSSPTPPPPSNPDLLSPASFGGPLRHSRPGTLSLALAASDEDDAVRMRPGYRPAEFLITTGPGPVPSLDGGNIVFGRVESGLAEVVGAVSRVKVLGATPGPFGDLARAIGDERVRRVTAKYGRPLQLVVITKAGVL